MNLQLSDYVNKDNIAVKEEIVDGQKLYIVSYVFIDSELWRDEKNLEARGLVFDENGSIVCRPFEKFFNLNENQFTQYNDLDFTGAEYYEKVDGSMVTPVVFGDKIYFKTKKSFYSEVAQSCQQDFGDNKKLIEFCMYMKRLNMTPIFEYTSPSNRVVVDYGQEPRLTLLDIRRADGMYMLRITVEYLAKCYKLDIVKKYDNTSIQDILKEDIENREGYVVKLKSGQRVKVKFPSYLLKHHTLNRLTEKNIAAMVIEECIDDFKAMVDSRHLPKIEAIERKVIKQLEWIQVRVECLCNHWKINNLQLSTIGKNYSTDEFFNCAIMVHRGSDLDIMVRKHYNSKVLPTLDNKQLW